MNDELKAKLNGQRVIASVSGGKDSAALSLCFKCKRSLPVTAFYADRRRPCGLQHRCIECQSADGTEYKKKRKQEGLVAYETKSYRRMRVEVLSAYSQGCATCACCGEQRIEFLSIDHVAGGGRKHRAQLRANTSRSIYRELKKQCFPPGFRVLCHNCNQSLGLYGYCPHGDPEATTDRWIERRTVGWSAKAKGAF